MTLIDKTEAHDDDLIRRGDALKCVMDDPVATVQHLCALSARWVRDDKLIAQKANDAREVFSGTCDTAKQAIDYLEQLILAALPTRGVGVPAEDIDALAYRFWSIHPKDIPEAVGMPEGYKGGRRAWFMATEIRRILAALSARGVGLHDLPDGVLMAAMMAVEEMDHQLNWFQHWGGDVSGWKDDADPEIRGRYADALERVAQFRRILAALSPAAQPGTDVAAQAREAALSVLAGLSSYLGTGLGDDDTTAEQFDKRIRWAIDDLTARTRQAALREAAAEVQRWFHDGRDNRDPAALILALIGEPRT